MGELNNIENNIVVEQTENKDVLNNNEDNTLQLVNNKSFKNIITPQELNNLRESKLIEINTKNKDKYLFLIDFFTKDIYYQVDKTLRESIENTCDIQYLNKENCCIVFNCDVFIFNKLKDDDLKCIEFISNKNTFLLSIIEPLFDDLFKMGYSIVLNNEYKWFSVSWKL